MVRGLARSNIPNKWIFMNTNVWKYTGKNHKICVRRIMKQVNKDSKNE
jgi:hypothetical protein